MAKIDRSKWGKFVRVPIKNISSAAENSSTQMVKKLTGVDENSAT